MELLFAFIVAMAIQYALFVPAFLFKTDKLTDLSYGITFILLVLMFYGGDGDQRGKVLLATMIIMWAIRLVVYLFARIHRMKRDERFDGMRESLPRFLKFWTLQGVAVFIIMLAPLLYFSNGTEYSKAGVVIFIVGFLIETIADQQKAAFKSAKKNKDRWIETGLWKYSRHPNYLGEILVWIGIYAFVFPGLGTAERVIGALSPLFIIVLLLFVSGIPLLEKRADQRWGRNKEYNAYKRKTAVLIPFIGW